MTKLPNLVWLPAAALSMNVFAADYLTVAQAQQVMFATADEFIVQAVHLNDAQLDAIKDKAGVKQRSAEPDVWMVKEGGEFAGWFLTDQVIGKHEFISYAVAISPAGKVIGLEIMSYRETHGGQVRNPDWRIHFMGKQLGDKFKLNKDIPNISGATLSCRNITDGVKRLLALHDVALQAIKVS